MAIQKLKLLSAYTTVSDLRRDVKRQLDQLKFWWGNIHGRKTSDLKREGVQIVIAMMLDSGNVNIKGNYDDRDESTHTYPATTTPATPDIQLSLPY